MMVDQFPQDVTSAEQEAIAAFMERVARAAVTPNVLPPAQVLWWKAQLLRRWEAERRATLPLDAAEPLQVLSVLTTAALLIWVLPTTVGVEATSFERAFEWAVVMLQRLSVDLLTR
jgi:hypothetical protein